MPTPLVQVKVTSTLLVPVKFCVFDASPTIPLSGSVHVTVAILCVASSIPNVITGGV